MNRNRRAAVLPALFLLSFPPAWGSTARQEPGTAVLARRDIAGEFHYFPATFERSDGDRARVLYLDGGRATVPEAAIVWRSFEEGDFVVTPSGPARVVGPGRAAGNATVRVANIGGPDSAAREVAAGSLQAVLRTDRSVEPSGSCGASAPGARVLAKWDARSWWVATVDAVQGEAVQVTYDDGSVTWLPCNRVVPFDVAAGDAVLGTGPDGQPIPATVVAIDANSARLRFFDGSERDVSLGELLVFHDQVGLDFGDPCRDTAGEPPTPPHADTLRGWLTPKTHYYFPGTVDERYQTNPEHVELGFVLFLPSDRTAPEHALEIVEELAAQVAAFLERELVGVRVTTRVHPEPVVGRHTLEWYRANLDEEDPWHVWRPTADAVRAVFPEGPKSGRHRVAVTIPDTPGISDDDSGNEDGMGFVRAHGDWFQGMTLAGVRSAAETVVTHDQWRPDFLSATLAHEVLHTLGLPHTDGDPWSIMNLGPWFPIAREEVHVAELHKLVMRSPFRSLSLSQGMAAYLLDPARRWLGAIRRHEEWDTRLRLVYADGTDRFDLRRTLASFGPESRGREGVRDDSGERALCRAHLAAFVAFYLEAFGPETLRRLFDVGDEACAEAAARAADLSVDELEGAWHAWLEEHGA